MSLANIRQKAKLKPPILVLYGPGGIGKTSFGATMNKPIIVQAEDGIGKIECPHFPVAKTYTELEGNLKSLIQEDSEFKTVIVDSLDWLENRLAKQRYLVGDQITEADWRLFTTLIRFDAVYHGHFKCNREKLSEFHHISNYINELYQVSGIKETVDLEYTKVHYYASHITINPTQIVPLGAKQDFDAPHDREKL